MPTAVNLGVSLSTADLGRVSTLQVFRGLGQAMAVTSTNGVSYAGGTNWSQCTRSRHYSNASFRRFRVVLQTFDPSGTSPVVDTDFVNSFNFQVGFEYPYVLANTGIPARVPVTFSAANSASYVAGSGPFGYILSDVIDLGFFVPARAFFGLWTTIENAAAGASGSNTIPTLRNLSNYLERYVGVTQAASSLISAGTALSASSITHGSTARTGATGYFTPCMMLIEVPATTKCVVQIGDSVSYGIGEGGTDFSSTSGDIMGPALANPGAYQRGLYENAGVNAINLGRGNDGNKFLITAANWKYRRALMALANPTHVINQNGINDVQSSITTNGWLGNTAYNLFDAKNNGTNQYLCVQGGTSAASGGPTGTGKNIVDGTCLWSYIQAKPAAANAQGSAVIYGWDANVTAQIVAAAPAGTKIIGAQVGPNASSTDLFVTTTNQTSNWGTPNPTRRTLLDGLRGSDPAGVLGWSSLININQYLENDYTNAPGIWIADGVNANTQTQDGIHPNSSGANTGAACITAGMFT